MLACRNGHLDEFPWVAFVHRGAPCAAPVLELFERNQSSRADDVMATCKGCGLTRSMVEAFGEAAARNLPKCRARHPHLRTVDAEPCTQRNRALLLGASNAWFSSSLKVLAVPPAATPLAQIVDDLWPHLVAIPSKETLEYARSTNPLVRELAGYDLDDLWTEIELHRAGGAPPVDENEDLLAPEWAQLSDPAHAVLGPDFQLREVAAPTAYASIVERVVLAERLREVVALVGFTRIDPPGDPDPTGAVAVEAPIARGAPTWVPCTEVRGEGIFIQFREDAIASWEAGVAASGRLEALSDAHQRWRQRRKLLPTEGWPGSRYIALHTFSHLLMREVALECGYGSASISERIYSRTGAHPMAGVLLYTAAPDSEGTLGGLVSLGEPASMERLLRQAFAHAASLRIGPDVRRARPRRRRRLAPRRSLPRLPVRARDLLRARQPLPRPLVRRRHVRRDRPRPVRHAMTWSLEEAIVAFARALPSTQVDDAARVIEHAADASAARPLVLASRSQSPLPGPGLPPARCVGGAAGRRGERSRGRCSLSGPCRQGRT